MLCHFNTLKAYTDFFSQFSFGSIEIITDISTNKVCWFNSSTKSILMSNNADIEKFGNDLLNNDDNSLCFNKMFQVLTDKGMHGSLFITKLEFKQKIAYAKVYANIIYNHEKQVLGCYYVISFIPNYNPIIYSSAAFRSNNSCLVILNQDGYQHHLPVSLNQREHEIITLLAMYKSHKEVSNILTDIYKKDISPTVITTTISRGLYPKFGTKNVSDMICRAIESGVLDFMPASLLGAEF